MSSERLYWIVSGLILLYLIYKYRNSYFLLLIILFFFEGFFTFWSQLSWDVYKISLPVFALITIWRQQKYMRLSLKDKKILWAFALFSLSFLISSFINHDYLLLFLNQYSRFLLPILIFLLVKAHINRYGSYERLKKLIWTLLNVQIGMSILNFMLMGVHEPIVGTISSNGGSAATNLPVLAFMYLWIDKNGVLSRKDWVYVLLLSFIGFVSGKRAIWLIMPLFIFVFTFYVQRIRIRRGYFLVLLLVPLLFYLGLRLNPTFNSENRIWGSFDYNYFYNYAKTYTFGDKYSDNELVVGRGGATIYTFESIFSFEKSKSIFGNGLINMYAFGHNVPENTDSPIKISELNSITMATGLFQNYYTGGLAGVLLFLLMIKRFFDLIYDNRTRLVIVLFFLWEYLMYANNLVRTPALFSLLILIIFLSNQNYHKPVQRN